MTEGVGGGFVRLARGAGAAAGTLAVLEAARALGEPAVPALVTAVASAAVALALAAGASDVARIWRGPAATPFRRREAVRCDVAEAAAIRSAAQRRGRTGGAGHLHRFALLFPAAAWAAVAVQAAAVLVAGEGPPVYWPLAGVLAGWLLGVLFPAAPFWYREIAGGCVLAHPPLVGLRIVESAGVPPALTQFDPGRIRRKAPAAAAAAVPDRLDDELAGEEPAEAAVAEPP